jgi:hypothetical protein
MINRNYIMHLEDIIHCIDKVDILCIGKTERGIIN